MPSPLCKVCGLDTPATAALAHQLGAAFFGFVFYPPSPRHLTPEQAATIRAALPPDAATVAVTVNADDAALDAITATLAPRYIQLHGSETPQRAAEIKARYGAGIIRAVGVRTKDDLAALSPFAQVADYLLLDAKPAGNLPGGTGHSFDWSLLEGFQSPLPWFLAGGLNAANVAEAVAQTGASMIDVSSGLESSPGVKSADAMRAFFNALELIR